MDKPRVIDDIVFHSVSAVNDPLPGMEFTITADPLSVYLAAPGTEFPGTLTYDLQPLTLRDRLHVRAGEFFGRLAGWALIKVGEHALAVKDGVTTHRVSEVLARGIEVGWSEQDPDDGKIVPHRGRGRSLCAGSLRADGPCQHGEFDVHLIPEPSVAHVRRDSLTGVTRTSPPPGRTV